MNAFAVKTGILGVLISIVLLRLIPLENGAKSYVLQSRVF